MTASSSSLFAASFACLLVLSSGCGSGSSADVASSEGSTSPADAGVDATRPAVPAGDLGRTCAGGCAGSTICTVTDATCATSHCLFDARSMPAEAYCTADCASAPCPSGFVCEDVPFQLQRACVRDKGAPAAPGAPRVKGTIRLDAAVGPASGVATAFAIDQAIDTSPAMQLSPLACGRAWITTPSRVSESGILLYLSACTPEVPALLTIEIPLRAGSYPEAGSTIAHPLVTAVVGKPQTMTYAAFGSRRRVAGATMTVDQVVATTSAEPWVISSLHARLAGTLPIDTDDPCTGQGCGVSSPNATFGADLTFTNVSPDPDGK